MTSTQTTTRTVGPVTGGATTGTSVAGSAAIIIVWAIGLTGLEVPPEVAAALAVLLGAAGALFGGWAVRPSTGSGKHSTP